MLGTAAIILTYSSSSPLQATLSSASPSSSTTYFLFHTLTSFHYPSLSPPLSCLACQPASHLSLDSPPLGAFSQVVAFICFSRSLLRPRFHDLQQHQSLIPPSTHLPGRPLDTAPNQLSPSHVSSHYSSTVRHSPGPWAAITCIESTNFPKPLLNKSILSQSLCRATSRLSLVRILTAN